MSIRIRGGRVIDPANERDEICDVFVHAGRIAAIGRAPRGFNAEWVIDAAGLVVCPGFVELGARMREPGFEHKATIASEARAAAASGFTTIVCTPDTQPVMDTPAVAEHVNQRAARTRAARVRYLGALTVGLEGKVLAEMQALKDGGCVGVTNVERAIVDTAVLRNALAYAATAGLTVFLQSEDHWLGRQGAMHEGATSTRLGVAGIPGAAETIAIQRDIALVAETGVTAHFCRLSSAASVKVIADARKAGLPVSADVGIMNLCFTDEDVDGYDANLHVRPPLRSERDRAGLGLGVKRGHIDAICAYHEPHDADAKAAPFMLTEAGASTLDAFLPALLECVERGFFDLPAAIRAASFAPHRVLGQTGGDLSPGQPADICVFNPRAEWTASAAALASAGKNSPWLGRKLTGKVMMTIVDGRIVHDGLDARR
jgi:dihydroorotase